VIGFFARQLMLLQMEKTSGHNGGFRSEYSKLNRFLSVINLNKESIAVNQFFSHISSIMIDIFFVLVYCTTYDI
jgi:hypothetical protein